ncbi:MAG TPA: hypothetical protein VMV23_05075 [Candidatus Nanopelagicaceae bacterium]|nr:hypothetical protein [Candidatus Nanopelagicaceae bacterium]
MDRVVLQGLVEDFLDPMAEFFRELDEAIRPRRGRSLVPVRVLIGGLVHQALTQRAKTITCLARTLSRESTPGQVFQLFGEPVGPVHQHRSAPEAPSVWRLYRTKAALASALGAYRGEDDAKADSLRKLLDSSDTDEAVDELAFRLIHNSAPPMEPGSTISIDTTKIPAACRRVSQKSILAGKFASDRQARWRKMKKGVSSFDDEAPPEEQSPLQKATAQYDSWLGYWNTSAVLTQGGREYVHGGYTRPANHNDWPVALKLVDRLLTAGDRPGAVNADRGFTGGRRWLDALRDRGLSPVFDFKEKQARRDPDWRGCLVLQGWPFLPQLPQRLWNLVAPGPNERKTPEGKKKWEQFYRDVEEREQYAMLVHGRPSPTKARVVSPLCRGRKLGCPKVPGSMRGRDPKLAVCDGNHGDDEACCIKTGTFKAEYSPLGYQVPHWGTKEWRQQYARRSGVERSYSLFKNKNVVGMSKEHFQLRGQINVSLLAMIGWVAVNLHLRHLDREAAAHPPKVPHSRGQVALAA